MRTSSSDTSAQPVIDVLRVLGNWHSRPGPLYHRLASAIADAIDRQQLLPGQPLPAERRLALDLAVGRSTVIKAYDALRSTGTVVSLQGSGTRVAAAPGLSRRSLQHDGLADVAPITGDIMIDLATASLPAAPEVAREIFTLTTEDLDLVLGGTGYSHAGLLSLRTAVAHAFTEEGLDTDPSQVLITSGAQQAISVIAQRFLSRGDVVVLEEPTSAGALDIFTERGTVLRTARSVSGWGAHELVEAVRRSEPQLVYVQLPLGGEGQMASGGDVVDLAHRLDSTEIVIEDASLRDLSFVEPPPYLASKSSTGVLTIGSMSKLYWGGLRIGWIRGPEALIETLARTKARADLGSSILSQLLAARLLPHAASIRAARIAEIQRNVALAEELLSEQLPDLEWRHPDGGLAIWVRLPQGTSAPFAELARRHGVLIAAGESLSSTGVHNDRIRLSLAAHQRLFQEGIQRLADTWREFADPQRRHISVSEPIPPVV